MSELRTYSKQNANIINGGNVSSSVMWIKLTCLMWIFEIKWNGMFLCIFETVTFALLFIEKKKIIGLDRTLTR